MFRHGITLCRSCHIALHNFSLLVQKAKKSVKFQLLSELLKALDNTEPSKDSNDLEGVTTNSRVLTDSNADTRIAADSKA